MKNLLSAALAENNLNVEAAAQEKLLIFLNLMQTWNRVYNLTTITEPRDMVYLHLVDSLVVQPYLHGKKMLDIGTGAGLPGIPLAIINPQRQWVLLDKNNKKIRFLTQVIAELGLHNVKAVHERGQDFQPELCFDSILSRAFGTLKMFVETTQHLLCEQGVLIAMKGKHPQEELNTLPDLFKVKNISRLEINGINVERHIVCLTKEGLLWEK